MKRLLFTLLMLFLFLLKQGYAQNGYSQVSYQNLALQFSNQHLNGDPAAGIIPSVADENGFGSYFDNPASTALIDESYFQLGILRNSTNEEDTYFGNTYDLSGTNTKLSNVGVVYKLPTAQGSLVMGAGYNIQNNIDREHRLNARNNESTLTDEFKNPNSDYYDIAYEAFAIDWETTNSTNLESIFRIGFQPGEFPGITQSADIDYSSTIGEYSMFLSTEFRRNLFIGVSIGLTSGNYKYRREFFEIDEFNDYDGDFIPSEEPDEYTDVKEIFTEDRIDAEIRAFNLRTGIVYKVNEYLNVGGSIQIPSKLNINEEYYALIENRLDDGSLPFRDSYEDDSEYNITRPAQYNLGVTYHHSGKISVSGAVEFIDYAKTDVEFINNSDARNPVNYTNRQRGIADLETRVNDQITEELKAVANLRAGLKYMISENATVKAGYGYYPGRSKKFANNKNIISGGLSYHFGGGLALDLSAQYSTWKDRSVAYSYIDNVSGNYQEEIIAENVDRFNINAGIRFLF